MLPVLDADIHLLDYRGGIAQTTPPPGLLAQAAPRRAARGRERDFLFLALTLTARGPVEDRRVEQLARLGAKTYFGTPGSVTAALREATTAVNARLLQHNLRGAATGAHIQGGLTCAVLRNLDLYLSQCGPALALVVHPLAVERYPTRSTSARPLGISHSLDVQYFHTRANADDLLLLSAAPPIPWENADFIDLTGAPLDRVRTRLVRAAGADFSAMLIHFVPPGTASAEPPEPAAQRAHPVAAELSPAASPPAEPSRPDASPASPALKPIPGAPPLAPPDRPVPPRPSPETPPGKEESGTGEPLPRFRPGRSLRAMLRAFGVTLAESVRGLRVLLARILPEGVLQREGLFSIPTSLLLAIAIALPLLIVPMASMVYIQRGRLEQYQRYLSKARNAMAAAREQPDLLEARPHYQDALRALERAEEYARRTDETLALYLEARGALDDLDGITRLQFRPAIPGGFGRDAHLTRVIIGNRNIFALDESANAVRLARASADAFDYDDGFPCSPQAAANLTIGTLVDMAWMPGRNVLNEEAALLVFDRNGSVLYCAPGVSPLAARLTEPEGGWARPLAIDIFADRLYVLDPGANEIWLYDSNSGVFNQRPYRYFTSLAYDLSDVLDFTIAQGEVFLLHADGTLTSCSRPDLQEAAHCENLTFVDGRMGRSDGPRIDGAVPSRLLYDMPPEPSLYFVDTIGNGVFQHSLKLVFQRQYHPLNPLDAAVEAVAIGPSKEIYLAAGNNVYVADR